METLTERQEVVLSFITGSFEKRRIPPTIREIQKHFGFESTNAVVDHLNQLERKGYLRRRPGISRGIELAASAVSFHPAVVRVPIVGQIAAGAPLLAEENLEGYVHLDRTLIRGDGYFLLKVRGDSMRDAGIHDRDLVLVKKQEQAESGDIVAAYWEGEATVKRYVPKRGHIELHPANPRYAPIRITKEKQPDFRILGKVRALIRVF